MNIIVSKGRKHIKESKALVKWVSTFADDDMDGVIVNLLKVGQESFVAKILNDLDGFDTRYTWAETLDRTIKFYQGTADYPYKTSYIEAAGNKWLKTWQEELVCFIAHEMKHIDQFAKYGMTKMNKWMKNVEKRDKLEEEAEKFGFKVLDAYRAKLRKAAK